MTKASGQGPRSQADSIVGVIFNMHLWERFLFDRLSHTSLFSKIKIYLSLQIEVPMVYLALYKTQCRGTSYWLGANSLNKSQNRQGELRSSEGLKNGLDVYILQWSTVSCGVVTGTLIILGTHCVAICYFKQLVPPACLHSFIFA